MERIKIQINLLQNHIHLQQRFPTAILRHLKVKCRLKSRLSVYMTSINKVTGNGLDDRGSIPGKVKVDLSLWFN